MMHINATRQQATHDQLSRLLYLSTFPHTMMHRPLNILFLRFLLVP